MGTIDVHTHSVPRGWPDLGAAVGDGDLAEAEQLHEIEEGRLLRLGVLLEERGRAGDRGHLGEQRPRAVDGIELAVDLRYQGQAYEIPIAISGDLDAAAWQAAAGRFHTEHLQRYGFDMPKGKIEVVTLRVTAIGDLPLTPQRVWQAIDSAAPTGHP